MTSYGLSHFKQMVQDWKTKSLSFCLRDDPLKVIRRQNHVTFIFIKTMSYDLLVQVAYWLIIKSVTLSQYGIQWQIQTIFFLLALPAFVPSVMSCLNLNLKYQRGQAPVSAHLLPCSAHLLISGRILSTTGNLTYNNYWKSSTLSCSRCYELWPLMTALVMMTFIVNNRTDAWKTDVNLFLQ